MSYDLELLHARGAVQVGSVRFATATDLAGTAIIAAVAGESAVVHQIFVQASAFASISLGRATGAASSYWFGFGNQTALVESTRFVVDASAALACEAASGIGNGVIRVYFTMQRNPNSGGPAIGNL